MRLQQVIPLLPFGYATESVDQVSSRHRKITDGMSVVAARLACMETDRFLGHADAGGPARGHRIKYLHFWGHRPRPDGRLGASCLSQWWPSPFTVDGVAYATAEHWMMAAKARLFGDAEAERAGRGRGAARPQAKKAGRLVRGFDDAVWERERFAIVVEGSVHKFAADPALRAYLLGTGRAGSSSRPARSTGSGASGSRRTTPAPTTPARWRAPTCWASR